MTFQTNIDITYRSFHKFTKKRQRARTHNKQHSTIHSAFT